MWFFLALGSALIYSCRSLLEKKYLASVNPYVLALAVRVFALPLFTLPFILGIAEPPSLSDISFQFWLAVLVVACISTPLEMIFFYKALKREEVSYVAPLLGLSPLLTALASGLVFHDWPSGLGLLGMLVIVAGLYTLNAQKQQQGLFEPFRRLFNNRAFKYILLMLISYSIGIVIDKLAIGESDVYFYALINYLFVSVALFFISWLKAGSHLGQLKTNARPFAVIGVVVAGYTWLRFWALDLGNAGYVAAALSTNIIFRLFWDCSFSGNKTPFVNCWPAP